MKPAKPHEVAHLEEFVRAQPGWPRKLTAKYLADTLASCQRSMQVAHQVIDRCVKHGMIRMEWDPAGTYRLYPVIPFADERWCNAECAVLDMCKLIDLANQMNKENHEREKLAAGDGEDGGLQGMGRGTAG